MKRIAYLIFIGITIIYGANAMAAASTYTFEWENTVVYVNALDSISNYLTIPKAYLCVNGERTDDYVGMLWGEDETDPDFIDTSTLGTYYLTYRAVSEIEETATITFVVVDVEAPTINLISDLKTQVGKSINYSNYFQIYDNYYSTDSLTILFDDRNINYNKEGQYTLEIIVTDLSNNVSREEVLVTINALTSNPTYEPKIKEFKIEYGEEFVPSSYYNAYDASGKDISSHIEAELDTTSLGSHRVEFSVVDDYQNVTTWSQMILVYDSEAPTIELIKDRIEINVSVVDTIDKQYFLNLIESYSDNSEIKSIEVEYSNVKKAIGEYSVVYTLKDISDNITTKTLVVVVICDSVPIIEVKDIYISVGGNINYYNYFKAYDTYDGDITLNATIDSSNVDTKNEGIYFAYISVKNSYGKSNYASITVHVKQSFLKKYYWVFLIPVGVGIVIGYFVIKKRKSMV